MTELYLGAMDKIWALTPSPNVLMYIEGGGQGDWNGGRTIPWGNGAACDRDGRSPNPNATDRVSESHAIGAHCFAHAHVCHKH